MSFSKNLINIASAVSILAMSVGIASASSDYNNNNNNNADEAVVQPRTTLTETSLWQEPDFKSLEAQFPDHFKGFSATSMDLVKMFRRLQGQKNLLLKPVPELRTVFADISEKLNAHGDTFATLKSEIGKFLLSEKEPNLSQYLYIMFRVALFQGTGTQEEAMFFKGAGFPEPYKAIFKLKLQPNSTDGDFLLQLLEMNMDSDDEDELGEFSRSVQRSHWDKKDRVANEFVEKGPFSSVVLPLFGEDVLGFFYLAWTYSQGIHPVPFPLEDNNCHLHGIAMSRYAKICHDLAHSEADAVDHSVEQFANYLISHHKNMLALMLQMLTPEARKHFAVKSVIPHYATFAMAVHNLYHQSLMDILRLALLDMDPRNEARRSEFEAFSVGAFLHAHENPTDLSGTYGTPVLEDVLKGSVDLEPDEDAQEEQAESAKEESVITGDAAQPTEEEQVKKQPKGQADTIFKTSYVKDGASPLTDEEIFDIVKRMDRSSYLREVTYYGIQGPIPENEIIDYEVERNKFFIEVRIHTYNGQIHTFRQRTNYTNQLNFEHDMTILNAARAVLKSEYNYDLPVLPNIKDFDSEDSYAVAAGECLKQLDIGEKHLLDYWLKNAIRLSQMPLGSAPSIAERFATGYKAAAEQLISLMLPADIKETLPPFLFGVAQVDLQAFIKAAQQPGAVYGIPPLPVVSPGTGDAVGLDQQDEQPTEEQDEEAAN